MSCRKWFDSENSGGIWQAQSMGVCHVCEFLLEGMNWKHTTRAMTSTASKEAISCPPTAYHIKTGEGSHQSDTQTKSDMG
jgi:hypothetical protein